MEWERIDVEKKVKDFFNFYVNEFVFLYLQDRYSKRLINNLFRRSVYVRFDKTIEGCKPYEGRTALDVGCGPGLYCVELARRGIEKVVGIDFAPKMIEFAQKMASQLKVDGKIEYIAADFLTYDFAEQFDYTFAMGFIEYCSYPSEYLKKMISLTKRKVFLSFPKKGGILAWQRKLRYKFKCPLFLYSKEEIENLVKSVTDLPFTIEKISRDYFVTIFVQKID
ncbi:MAG: class I SAM-dependent methyltransferase [Ignavibacteria bacterium]|nr:class I SAM-dependent methyltransferase [Ignavibacteria bacterium]